LRANPAIGVKVVSALADAKLPDAGQFWFNAMPLLLEAVEGDEAVTAVAAVIRGFPFESVAGPLEAFVGKLIVGAVDEVAAVYACADLRLSFVQMEVFYDALFERFIGPMTGEPVAAGAVLRHFRRFDTRLEHVSGACETAIHFVSDERIEVSIEASKLLKKLLIEFYNAGSVAAVVDAAEQIMRALFGALTDGAHTGAFRVLAKAVSAFFTVMAASAIPPAEFDAKLVEVIGEVAGNSALVGDFARYLRGCYADLEQLIAAIGEFLVAIRCASETDRAVFARDGIEMDDMMKELLGMVPEADREAIRSEEFDLLTELANLDV
jgi:hypothetical protein